MLGRWSSSRPRLGPLRLVHTPQFRILCQVLGRGATVQADAPPGGEAHPPFRVHGNARTSPTGYSPTQIRHAYGFDQQGATGADQVIGIVDAFDDPNIAANLGTFITTFHLPTLH